MCEYNKCVCYVLSCRKMKRSTCIKGISSIWNSLSNCVVIENLKKKIHTQSIAWIQLNGNAKHERNHQSKNVLSKFA